MIDESVIIFFTLGYFIYKLFELFAMRRERMTIINKLECNSIAEYIKRMPLGIGIGCGDSVAEDTKPSRFKMWPIRLGCFLLCIGVGIFIATKITADIDFESYSGRINIRHIYGSCICIGAGIGLITSFIIDLILNRKND